ncbi:sugar ABC transporter ATP-binding protein [Sneathiella litorea]|uniref:ATP-binding cassette domain-containing protein n=1 Tax=Sneathiella litorea TaxID=2606216 RepID=A0A6L8WCA5_9PROT|nr:sugar ABC transporter ATP-binding protein [Sneathiella litorea]MZR32329.1 ATP-binding cassette domain-containing protein [Sneathiella litorea]
MLLEIKGLTKRFPGVLALEGVDFTAEAGEVHALVGANGAGKSTLMNLLSGVFRPTEGEILIDNRPVQLSSPGVAVSCGVSTVYQEFSSIPQLTVAQNIFLGREPCGKSGILSHKKMRSDARAILDKYNLDLDETSLVETLSVANLQLVEIARALSVDSRILILDEPTAVLSLPEQENLFRIIESLKQQGMLILYVSHRMEEIFSISDRVTVLRDGRKIDTVQTADISPQDIIRMMIGHDIDQSKGLKANSAGDTILEVSFKDRRRGFKVLEGEILGVAGLVGAGRTRLARKLIGLEADEDMDVILHGDKIDPKSPGHAIQHGIVYLTENRKYDGLFANLSVLKNTTASALERFSSYGFLQQKNERQAGTEILDRLHLVASSVDAPISDLSGGNQQKAIFGRALLCNPRVLICDEPTRGVDVGAKEEIYQLLLGLAEQGVAIIFISSEMKELFAAAHRLLVLHEGEIVEDLPTDQLTEEKVLQAATGTAA